MEDKEFSIVLTFRVNRAKQNTNEPDVEISVGILKLRLSSKLAVVDP